MVATVHRGLPPEGSKAAYGGLWREFRNRSTSSLPPVLLINLPQMPEKPYRAVSVLLGYLRGLAPKVLLFTSCPPSRRDIGSFWG